MSRPFEQILRDLGRGDTLNDLTDNLAELTAAVVEHEKSGELSLKLKLKPNGGTVIVTAEIKTTIPRPTRGSTLFFATSGGDLTRNDPRQEEFALRDVTAEGER